MHDKVNMKITNIPCHFFAKPSYAYSGGNIDVRFSEQNCSVFKHFPTGECDFYYFFLQVTKLKMYPYFDLAHAALCCLAVREDLSVGKVNS